MKKYKFLLVITILLLCCVLSSCGSDNKRIVGTWTNQEEAFGLVTETKYVFRDDGTGTMSTILGVDLAITYSIENGEIIISTSALGIINETKYQYKIDGKTLTMSNSIETIVLEKQE